MCRPQTFIKNKCGVSISGPTPSLQFGPFYHNRISTKEIRAVTKGQTKSPFAELSPQLNFFMTKGFTLFSRTQLVPSGLGQLPPLRPYPYAGITSPSGSSRTLSYTGLSQTNSFNFQFLTGPIRVKRKFFQPYRVALIERGLIPGNTPLLKLNFRAPGPLSLYLTGFHPLVQACEPVPCGPPKPAHTLLLLPDLNPGRSLPPGALLISLPIVNPLPGLLSNIDKAFSKHLSHHISNPSSSETQGPVPHRGSSAFSLDPEAYTTPKALAPNTRSRTFPGQ